MSGLSDFISGGNSGSGDSSNDPTQGGGVPWSQVLLAGVSGAIDSQLSHNYSANNAGYNTAGGAAGYGQAVPAAKPAAISPALLIGVVLVALVLVVVLVKK